MKSSAAMASWLYISLLLLAVAPQLYAIQVIGFGQFILFGKDSSSVVVNFTFESYAEALDAGERDLGFQILSTRKLLRGQDGRGFIQYTLLGRDDDIAKLVFLVDNLYLIGFANKYDHYFVLKGYGHLVPGATELAFGETYSELFGEKGIKVNLPKLAVGKGPFLDGVRDLSNSLTAEGAGPVMGMFAVMISEALRLVPVQAKLIEVWESGTVGFLDDGNYADYILNWSAMSRLVMCSRGGQPLRGRLAERLSKIRVTTEEQALEILNIVLWPSHFDPHNVWESCGDPADVVERRKQRNKERRQAARARARDRRRQAPPP